MQHNLEIDEDALLLTDDDDVNVARRNNAGPVVLNTWPEPVPRRDILRDGRVLVLRAYSGKLSMVELLEVLERRFSLHYITAISKKLRFNSSSSNAYIRIVNDGATNGFLASIRSPDGYKFRVNDITVRVKFLHLHKFELAEHNRIYIHDFNSVQNLHFNYSPSPNDTPTRTLIKVLRPIECNESTTNAVAGALLKINANHKTMEKYGSLILASNIRIDNAIESLKRLGLDASPSEYSSFILSISEMDELRENSPSNVISVCDLLLNNNLLVTRSEHDYFVNPRNGLFSRRDTRPMNFRNI